MQQNMGGKGAIQNVGQGKNPPVVRPAGASQPGPKGNYSSGKK